MSRIEKKVASRVEIVLENSEPKLVTTETELVFLASSWEVYERGTDRKLWALYSKKCFVESTLLAPWKRFYVLFEKFFFTMAWSEKRFYVKVLINYW